LSDFLYEQMKRLNALLLYYKDHGQLSKLFHLIRRTAVELSIVGTILAGEQSQRISHEYICLFEANFEVSFEKKGQKEPI
jgi:hypothetical protein